MKERTSEELSDFKRFIWVFRDLQKLSRQIHRINEQDCNGYSDFKGNWDEKAEQRAEKRKQKLLKKASELAESLGFKIYLQGDPRGIALYLITAEQTLKGSSCDYQNGIAVY